jgi:hypothetical protein
MSDPLFILRPSKWFSSPFSPTALREECGLNSLRRKVKTCESLRPLDRSNIIPVTYVLWFHPFRIGSLLDARHFYFPRFACVVVLGRPQGWRKSRRVFSFHGITHNPLLKRPLMLQRRKKRVSFKNRCEMCVLTPVTAFRVENTFWLCTIVRFDTIEH